MMMKSFDRARFLCTNKRIPGWRSVFCALILVLAIGSAGQRSPAHAAPAGADQIDFELSVYPEKLPRICVNSKLNLYAGVSKSVHKEIGGRVWNLPGTAPNPGITGVKLSGPGELKKQLQDIDGPPGSSIPFVFTSDEPGKVTLKFTVYIENKWIGAQEEVIGSSVKREKGVKFTVIPCKYEVKTVSNFTAQGVQLAALMDGEMKADEQGNFTGSATVDWIGGSASFGTCGAAYYDVAPSQANLTGSQDDSGQLTAEVNYLGAVITMSGCASASGTMIPDPLKITVSSSGGVSTLSQDLYEPNYFSFHGSAVITVIPVEDEAAAFIPSDPETQAGWNDFSSLFGALLALR